MERARRDRIQAAALRARAGRGQRRRTAGPVAAAASRPPRRRPRRRRLRGRARARRAGRAARAGARRPAHLRLDERRLPPRAPSRRATGSRSCSHTATGCASPSCTSRPTTRRRRRRRSPSCSSASATATKSRSATRSCASCPAARTAGRSCLESPSSEGRARHRELGRLRLHKRLPPRVGRRDASGKRSEAERASRPRTNRLDSLSERTRTYEAAGVSLATADAVVGRLRAAVESTGAAGFGRFAGLYPLDDGRFLAASTDGVGSKLMLAPSAQTASAGAGMDLAAHCIDDVLSQRRRAALPTRLRGRGARSSSSRSRSSSRAPPRSAARRAALLIGGETAELPGIYRDEELDFAGTCVGLVERERLIDGSRCEAGDVVVGFPSDRPAHERLLARPRARRRRRLRRRPPARAAPPLPRRGARPARAGGREGARARHRRRHPRQPLARAARGRARAASTGTRGSGRRCSSGSPTQGVDEDEAAARLQPRHRHVRRRPGRAAAAPS